VRLDHVGDYRGEERRHAVHAVARRRLFARQAAQMLAFAG
jgi:hypothetical protein